jgi:hypothetical protein
MQNVTFVLGAHQPGFRALLAETAVGGLEVLKTHLTHWKETGGMAGAAQGVADVLKGQASSLRRELRARVTSLHTVTVPYTKDILTDPRTAKECVVDYLRNRRNKVRLGR